MKKQEAKMDEKLMTVQEVADYLHLNKYTIYRMVKKRTIPAYKVAKQWRFKKSEIDKWIEKGKIKLK